MDGVVINYAKGKRIVANEVLDASTERTHDPKAGGSNGLGDCKIFQWRP